MALRPRRKGGPQEKHPIADRDLERHIDAYVERGKLMYLLKLLYMDDRKKDIQTIIFDQDQSHVPELYHEYGISDNWQPTPAPLIPLDR